MKKPEKTRVDISRMASTEVAEKGEFFLYNDSYRWEEGDWGGSVWVVAPEAAALLAAGGVNAVKRDSNLKECAAPFIIAQEKIGDAPGICIDFYNNPNFEDTDFISEKSNRGEGIVDALAAADKRDPLMSSVREMLRGIITARAHSLKRDTNKEAMSISCIFFHGVKEPQKVVANIFNEYEYQVSASPQSNGITTTVEVILPIRQFGA